MKRISLALATTVLLMSAGLAFGQNTPYIKNTLHNFSNATWSNNEICKPCHTPHNAQPASVSHAIWSHTMSTATYTLSDGTPGVSITDALDPYSRLCMSCHDGTVALDAFAGGTGTAGMIPSLYNVGTDLSNDHPVGNEAVYPLTSNSFQPRQTGTRGGGNTYYYVGTSNPAQGLGSLILREAENGTDIVVSCGTCHNPHGAGNGTIAPNGTGQPYPDLLRGVNTESKLCLTCHIK